VAGLHAVGADGHGERRMRGADQDHSLAGFAMTTRQIGKAEGVDYRVSSAENCNFDHLYD
jgi:hypothetical protein